MKTPSKSETLKLDNNGVFVIKQMFMRVRGLSVFKFKLDRKIKKCKIEKENGKTVQSERLYSISDILQSAVYWCCLSYHLQLSCLVLGFNSISQNRQNIFFIVLRHKRMTK